MNNVQFYVYKRHTFPDTKDNIRRSDYAAATVNFAGNHNLLKSTRESVKDSFDSQEQGFEIADKNITQSRLETAMVHRAKSLMSRLKIEKPSNHSIAYTLQKRALGLFLWFLRRF